ncbi:MAG: DsbA family protein [Jiangellaceae bacterium]
MSRDKAAMRARARELREAEARRQRRREQLVRFGVVAGVVVVVIAVAVAVLVSRRSADDSAAVPTGVEAPDGGVVVGDVSAPVTVDLWIDFQCPFCRDFELESGPTLGELAADGSVRLVYHPLSFLGEESERAANAFGCSVDAGGPAEYQRVLFENQPPEQTGGFTVDDLVALGEQAGITGDEFETCVADGTYDGWVANVAASQQEAGVTATPTVLVDGQTLDAGQLTPDGVRAAVEQAAA